MREPSQVLSSKNTLKVGHPAFARRFIRSFKDTLFKRVDNDEKKLKQHIQWTGYIIEIMITYNNKDVHSATGMTLNEARKKTMNLNQI